MNKTILSISFLIVSIGAFSEESKTLSLLFDPKEYALTGNNQDGVFITSKKNNVQFITNFDEPALPYVTINVKIRKEQILSNFKYHFSRILFKEKVILANTPKCVPTNKQYQYNDITKVKYADGIYPKDNVKYTGFSNYEDYTILHFLICPWIYDSSEKCLDIMNELVLSINLSDNANVKSTYNKNNNEFTNAISINQDEFPETRSISRKRNDTTAIDYAIVTSSSISQYFEPLKNWKTLKGVPTHILTTEYIDSTYSDSTIQQKIKHCLYDYYRNYNLQYVLLGGDNTIVPVQGCYSKVNNYEDTNIPSDIYYACFSGNFAWNANGNSIYGELEDSINFTPSLYVSRIPVRTGPDVVAFVDKITNYEKNPNVEEWHNNILMCGNKLWRYCSNNPTISDAQAKSENLYSLAIQPYWNGIRHRFYDTDTDFGGTGYNLTNSNLQNKLSDGYSFMDIATHGEPNNWSMEQGEGYNRLYAAELFNSQPTIITTMACHTNAFDNNNDPCLSEAFIRNPYNNIIAYWGCSRYGWGYNNASGDLGPSLNYERIYFERLFGNSIQEKNWGRIVANAKAYYAGSCSTYNAYRWLQLGMNPIGDPETPIYINIPIEFPQANVNFCNGELTLNTGIPGCRVCIMSNEDEGASIYEIYHNVDSITAGTYNKDISVCITKQGYIPKILFLKHTLYIQNEILSTDYTYEATEILSGTNVTSTKPAGDVTIDNCNIVMKADNITIHPSTTVNVGASLSISNR